MLLPFLPATKSSLNAWHFYLYADASNYASQYYSLFYKPNIKINKIVLSSATSFEKAGIKKQGFTDCFYSLCCCCFNAQRCFISPNVYNWCERWREFDSSGNMLCLFEFCNLKLYYFDPNQYLYNSFLKFSYN